MLIVQWCVVGEALEVVGRSGTGKTEVLYQAAVSCSLPEVCLFVCNVVCLCACIKPTTLCEFRVSMV